MAPRRARDFSDLDDVFLVCRATTHDWELTETIVTKHKRKLVWKAVWECGRERRAGIEFPNTRTDLIAQRGIDRGDIIDQDRAYADGYLLEPGLGIGRGRTKTVARVELMQRQSPRRGKVVPIRRTGRRTA